jgi:hypothetical protein
MVSDLVPYLADPFVLQVAVLNIHILFNETSLWLAYRKYAIPPSGLPDTFKHLLQIAKSKHNEPFNGPLLHEELQSSLAQDQEIGVASRGSKTNTIGYKCSAAGIF